jgi:release factor glutamine methyltransferase
MSGKQQGTPTDLYRKALTHLHHQTANFDLTQLFIAHFSERPSLLPPEIKLQPDQTEAFLRDVNKLQEGVPLQYLLGEWEFYSLPLKVGHGVLIPRPDTEILVDKALKMLSGRKNPVIADLCAGSGAIAIALAVNRLDAACTAVELSENALVYLRQNIALHQLEQRIKILQADIRLPLALPMLDLLISNPPYLTEEEMEHIAPQVRCEPSMALVAGGDGMDFYPILAQRGCDHVKPGGFLIVEVGINRAERVCEILMSFGFSEIETFFDCSGIKRCVCAKRPD